MLDLIFKILNFVIFILISAYIFKRYMLGDIFTEIKQANNQVYGLEKSIGELNEALQTEQLAVQEQKISYDQLLKQVQLWQQVCLDQQALRQAEQAQILADLSTKRREQSQMLVTHRLQKKLTKLIIKNSLTDLKAYFQDRKQVDQYQADLLNKLVSK